MLMDFATTVRDDVFPPTPSPLSVRGLLLYSMVPSSSGNRRPGVLSCKQTHPVKCSPDPRKDKNAMDGFGDYIGR